MKQFSLIFNVVLSVAVIALFVLHFSSKGSKALNSEEALGSAPTGSIVYVQLDSLMNKYDMFNDLKSELEKKAQAIQDDLTKKGRAFQRDYNDFNEKIQKGLITRAQAESLQQQLASRQEELQNLSQQKQIEMQEENAVMLRNVVDKLQVFLKVYNVEKNYAMILTTSGQAGNVIQADLSLDITNEVVEGMNQEYIKQKNKTK